MRFVMGLSVSLHGSPRAGVTIDVDQTRSAEDIGVDRDNLRIDPAHLAATRR